MPGVTIDVVAAIRAESPFVGRVEQLARLEELLEGARHDGAATVLLPGDAGVGKTRLLDEVATAASAAGDLVLVGHCVDLGAGGLPYLPFAEVLAAAGRGGQGEDGSALQEAAAAVVRRVAAERPVLARLAGQGPGGEATSEGMERLALFEALAALLAALSSEVAPLLLILEDVHWADASSRDLLRFLVSRPAADRMLVLASYRMDDLHRRHPMRPLLAELVRLPRVERLELLPFDEAELRRYLVALHGAALPEPVVAQIAARSEGNAYYAEELLAAREAGVEGLPMALSDVLLARVERLPAQAQQIARVAAVAGRRVPDMLLREASGLQPEEVEAALRDAVAHHVLVPDGQDGFAFRHALLQEALYADLLPGERVRLHGRYATRLRAEHRPAAAAELARHCLAAHDLPGALQASLAAAVDAESRLAPAEALAHYDRALQLWGVAPAEALPSGTDEVDLSLRASSAAGRAGELERAVALARAALGSPGCRQDVVCQARVRERLAQALYAHDRMPEALEQARQVRSLLTGRPPSATQVWAATLEARVAASLRDLPAVREVAAHALPLARGLGLASAEVDLMISESCAVEQDDVPGAEARLEQVWRRAVEIDDQQAALRAGYNLAGVLLDRGDLAGAAATARTCLAAAARAGLARTLYGQECRNVLLVALEAAGHWDEALAEAATSARELTPAQQWRVALPTLPILVARDPAGTIDGPAVEEPFGLPGAELAGYLAVANRAVADALTWLGRPAEAVRSVLQGLERCTNPDSSPHHLVAVSLCALGIAALADQADAARLRSDDEALAQTLAQGEHLAQRARRAMREGRPRLASVGPEGQAWLLRAEAEATRLAGRPDPVRWREAVDAFSGYGHRYETARCRLRLAEALAATGDRAEAGAQVRLAREVAAQLGALPLRAAIDALARRTRLDLGLGPAGGGGLTPREDEVIRLIATGLTNRQIGTRLGIAEKTASVHVSNILAKLGVASRAEAVDVAHRRGLVGADGGAGR